MNGLPDAEERFAGGAGEHCLRHPQLFGMTTMQFNNLFDWAITPQKHRPDVQAARARRELMRQSFTHMRAERQPEFCPPWVQGSSVGWRVLSPIDVTLTPLEQIEVANNERTEHAVRAVGKSQVWLRGGAALALDPPPWLNAYQFTTEQGPETMFLPNGLGTIEWRLGWTIADWGELGIIVIPSPSCTDLGVEIGVFTPATLGRIADKGMSIAISPKERITVSRGDEIARIIPISKECLKL